jgi:hypothetical protein
MCRRQEKISGNAADRFCNYPDGLVFNGPWFLTFRISDDSARRIFSQQGLVIKQKMQKEWEKHPLCHGGERQPSTLAFSMVPRVHGMLSLII